MAKLECLKKLVIRDALIFVLLTCVCIGLAVIPKNAPLPEPTYTVYDCDNAQQMPSSTDTAKYAKQRLIHACENLTIAAVMQKTWQTNPQAGQVLGE